MDSRQPKNKDTIETKRDIKSQTSKPEQGTEKWAWEDSGVELGF